MSLIISVRNFTPTIPSSCFIAQNATLIGEVTLGENCSVWFNAVVRGDVNYIRIGNRVNIQDGAIIHGTYQKAGTQIGNDVSIGHNAIIHGCTLENKVLIGMGAIVMDKAVIKTNSIVAAGAVVTQNTVVESGWVYAGTPAKKIKKLSPEMSQGEIDRIAKAYLKYASWFKN